ncbi:hypothetical protein CALVIDRAFT_377844 [Calocera viscosa TUFC12733]|uniref:Uncharacterized protein n=1 Tax=Calocera viscosa (strain TUFC12733) TaxID=1330018 RepID=A0A167Q1A9_CALVF|nr:hypothetical protein CALVIDRAFT_377844 [Calocera viscosa TUFC12733]
MSRAVRRAIPPAGHERVLQAHVRLEKHVRSLAWGTEEPREGGGEREVRVGAASPRGASRVLRGAAGCRGRQGHGAVFSNNLPMPMVQQTNTVAVLCRIEKCTVLWDKALGLCYTAYSGRAVLPRSRRQKTARVRRPLRGGYLPPSGSIECARTRPSHLRESTLILSLSTEQRGDDISLAERCRRVTLASLKGCSDSESPDPCAPGRQSSHLPARAGAWGRDRLGLVALATVRSIAKRSR